MIIIMIFFFFLQLFVPLLSLITMSCCCTPIFGPEQFGSIFPHSILLIANKPFSSKTSFCNSFWDSVVKYPYYTSSPFLTSMYVTRSVSLYNLYSFCHNSVLWDRVNHTFNLQPGRKGSFIRAHFPGERRLHA